MKTNVVNVNVSGYDAYIYSATPNQNVKFKSRKS